MNSHGKTKLMEMKATRMLGVTLLEVVLAIAIFAFGMLALVQLQGNLTRASSDANQRTVASNIAEELLEDIRGYERVTAVADNGKWEYLELTSTALDQTVPRGNLNYTVTATINDFWWDSDSETYIKTAAVNPPAPPAGTSQPYADFKLIEMNVAWNSSQEFYVDEDKTANLGDGSVTIHEIIPSSPPILGAKIAADINAVGGGPTVDYTPGRRPDIVRLALPNERFKESSTPEPEVIRDNESVETWFDVITYNQVQDATFLRREEFLVVTCECELKPGHTATEDTLAPTFWNGYGYTDGTSYTKDYGVEPANAQQSTYCDLCCRDHHDIPGEDDKDLSYRPSLNTTHKHYGFTKKGEMVEAGYGDTYIEACRMVRNDGFMRVAHDLEQAGFFAFPESYLEDTAGAGEYGAYVVNAATAYYGGSTFDQPGDVGYVIPASTEATATNLPTTPSPTKPLSTDYQQMRSRGVYLDHLTQVAADNIAACFDGLDGTPCVNPSVSPDDGDTAALMYPFFDVQLTWLARWNPAEAFLSEPVSVTNDPVETDNSHSRGYAELTGSRTGRSEIITSSHNGNLGLSGTGSIDPEYDANMAEKTVFVNASGDSVPHPVDGTVFSGMLSTEVNNIKTSDFVLTPSEGVFCGQTDVAYTCLVTDGAISPMLTLSNYGNVFGCSDILSVTATGVDYTTFSLEIQNPSRTNEADIWVQRNACVQVP